MAVAKNKQVASMKDLERQMQEFASGDKARVGEEEASSISIGGKRFTYKDEIIGSELAVIVLGFVHAHDDYDRPYDPDATTPPACFSRSIDGDEMQPAPESPAPVAEYCNGCPHDAFESAIQGGGKHCRNSYRLAVIEADADSEAADVAYLSVPPSSLKAWDKYIRMLADKLERPAFGVVTRFTFDETVDFPKLEMEVDSKITNAGKLGAIMARREVAIESLMRAPDVSGYEPPSKAKPKRGKPATKKKASKKKASKKKTGKSKFAA